MTRLLRLVMLIVLLGSTLTIASAQDNPVAQITVSGVDAANFPEVTVNFQPLNASGQFVSGLTDFSVFENGQPVSYVTVRLDDQQPVTLVFVLDLGRYASGEGNLLRQGVRTWVDGGYFRDGVDTVSIVTSGGGEAATIALPPTQSAADFRATIDGLDLTPGGPSQGLAAIEQVLATLAELNPAGSVHIVYFNRIVDTLLNGEAVAQAQTLGIQAREQGVPIYALHTDLDGNYAEPFETLATNSGGQYLRFNRHEDTGALLTTLYGQIATSGKSYIAAYRSASGDSAERTVTIGIPDSGIEGGTGHYQVTIAAPDVSVIVPEAGFSVLRTASDETAASDNPTFDVDTTPISFTVTWTDGLPRHLAQVELLVNGMVVQTLDSLTPLPAVEEPQAEPPPAAETTDETIAVIETYEIEWPLTGISVEGVNAQTIEVRVLDEVGIQTTSPAVDGDIAVEMPDVLPTITLESPLNNATIGRSAVLDSGGSITGYDTNEVALVAHLVWPGATQGEISTAEIVVDGTVVANFPFPTLVAIEQENNNNSDEPPPAEATLELHWDVSAVETAGPNLRDVQIQVRNAQGVTAISQPITVNLQVVVPQLRLPTVTVISPQANANLTRVALPRLEGQPQFFGGSTVTVIAGIVWPDNTPRTLVVAELLINGVPMGTQTYPSLLSGEEVGVPPNQTAADMRYFGVTWDIGAVQTAGTNLKQVQVRVRDADGFEAVSEPVTVNVQVDIIAPPTVTVNTPSNNTTIVRAGQIDRSGAQPLFDINETNVDVVIEWSPQLPFALSGADLLANGSVVRALAPAEIDAANQSLVELPDGRQRLTLRIPWSLQDIQTSGANLFQLQVRVRGGDIEAISAPVNLNVQVNPPVAAPPLVNVTSPAGDVPVQAVDNRVIVVAEILWPDGQARDLQFVELAVDGVVQQTLLYPQGTRFELAWDRASGSGSHQLTVRVRDVGGVEGISPTIDFNVSATSASSVEVSSSSASDSTNIPVENITETGPVVTAATCPPSLLDGWGDTNCLRERAIAYLPWAAVIVMGGLLFLRTREIRPGGITRTIVGVGRKRRPIAQLYIVRGPADLVGQSINVYTNVTSLGRDPRLCDIQFFSPDDQSSVSTQHCTIRHVRGRFSLMDDNSTNGTQVNGQYVSEPALLNDGDEITLGIPDRMGVVLRFQSKVVDMKDQEAKAPAAKPEAAVKSPPISAPVRAQARSLDMVDNILSEIAEKTDGQERPTPGTFNEH